MPNLRSNPSTLLHNMRVLPRVAVCNAQKCVGAHIVSQCNTEVSARTSACLSQVSRREVVLSALLTTLLPPAQPSCAHAAYVNEDAAQRVFDACSRSVVAIEDFTTGQSGVLTSEGVGSGFVWSNLGYIVTNYHCVSRLARDKSGKERTHATFYNEDGTSTSYDATIVGVDPSHDLAVLRIDAPPEQLIPVTLGSSADLKVGQSVYAIGNPSGLSRTQTAGVVSGLNRAIPSPTGILIPGAIQTDASINAGNSGGPLLDSFGRLVGVNTATFTRQGTGRGSGVNFALPSDLVVKIVPSLIVYGSANATVTGVNKRV